MSLLVDQSQAHLQSMPHQKVGHSMEPDHSGKETYAAKSMSNVEFDIEMVETFITNDNQRFQNLS